MPIEVSNLFFDSWDTDRMRSVQISNDTSLKYSPAPTNLQVEYFLGTSDVSIFSTMGGFFFPKRVKGTQLLCTVSGKLWERFTVWTFVTDLMSSWILELILALIWPWPYTSQKNLCLKAKRQVGAWQKWPVNKSPALREMWKCWDAVRLWTTLLAELNCDVMNICLAHKHCYGTLQVRIFTAAQIQVSSDFSSLPVSFLI